MRATDFLLLLLYAGGMAAGQVLFKLASVGSAAARANGTGWFRALLLDPSFIAAVALYGSLTIYWVWLLSFLPLSTAYPFSVLSIVVVPLLAVLLFGEHVGASYWLGLALISAGLLLVTR
jgi:undecaprenyl phosphate-alpha-L-ara4N flippase subunit ArnE